MLIKIELGSTPCEEACAQVGSENYELLARQECLAYKNQLNRMLVGKEVPEDFSLRLVKNLHEFGSYLEVAAIFDENNEKSYELLIELENNLPSNWDDLARAELGIRNESDVEA